MSRSPAPVRRRGSKNAEAAEEFIKRIVRVKSRHAGRIVGRRGLLGLPGDADIHHRRAVTRDDHRKIRHRRNTGRDGRIGHSGGRRRGQQRRRGPRLLAGIAAGIATALLAPSNLNGVTRVLLGWNGGIWTYLLLIAILMARATPAQVRQSAANEDETARVVVLLVCIAAVAGLAAIILELANAHGRQPGPLLLRYGFTVVAIAGCWLLAAGDGDLHLALRAPVLRQRLQADHEPA